MAIVKVRCYLRDLGAHGDHGSERATRAAILGTAADCGHSATGHGVIGSRLGASTER